jgi:hypothetical protein
MNKAETIEVLTSLTGAYSSFQMSEGSIAAYQFDLEEFSKSEVLTAIRAIKRGLFPGRSSAFAPTTEEIMKAILQLRQPDARSTSEAFLAGPHKAQTDNERTAWQRWGGSSRWGGLPDRNPRWCENLEKADQAWRKAEKEFAAILEGLNDRAARHEAIEATPEQARNFLSLVAKKQIGEK